MTEYKTPTIDNVDLEDRVVLTRRRRSTDNLPFLAPIVAVKNTYFNCVANKEIRTVLYDDAIVLKQNGFFLVGKNVSREE